MSKLNFLSGNEIVIEIETPEMRRVRFKLARRMHIVQWGVHDTKTNRVYLSAAPNLAHALAQTLRERDLPERSSINHEQYHADWLYVDEKNWPE